jgi:hypothetical protein
MTTARELRQKVVVYCPMWKNYVLAETCTGEKIDDKDEPPCRYFKGYGIWYIPGYRGRDTAYGIGCDYTHEDWVRPGDEE